MKQQHGFTIVMAMFILVVLALLGGYMVRLSGVGHATSTYTLQGARAYQAAKAGLGWAIAKIKADGTAACAEINNQSAFTLPGISGFTVKLTCSYTTYAEGSQNPKIYKLSSRSEFGAYAGNDYVSRALEVSIVKL